MSNNIAIQIWGREFVLNTVFQNFPGEEITTLQKNTLNTILDTDIDSSLEFVKAYIKKNNSDDLDDNSIKNIFRFVMPKSIIIPRIRDEKRVFAIMCNYKFDMEHGMAVVFENDKFKSVGPQDIIL